MTEITVQQVIAKFKGIKREYISSNEEADAFLNILKLKTHWTLEEYKEFFLNYALENMRIPQVDSLMLSLIKKRNNIKLNWDDYLNVIDNIKDVKIQKKYINHYFRYYDEMNENYYVKLMGKPYFKFLLAENKLEFLSYSIKTDNSNVWLNKYFTPNQLAIGIRKSSLFICLNGSYRNNNNTYQEKETGLKEFFNQYEHLFNNQSKIKFFFQVVQSGSVELIKFLYIDKSITKMKVIPLLWEISKGTKPKDTLEVLNCLKELGFKFIPKDLEECQKSKFWSNRENKEEIEHFFKMLESEKSYHELNIKFKKKNMNNTINKI